MSSIECVILLDVHVGRVDVAGHGAGEIQVAVLRDPDRLGERVHPKRQVGPASKSGGDGRREKARE